MLHLACCASDGNLDEFTAVDRRLWWEDPCVVATREGLLTPDVCGWWWGEATFAPRELAALMFCSGRCWAERHPQAMVNVHIEGLKATPVHLEPLWVVLTAIDAWLTVATPF